MTFSAAVEFLATASAPCGTCGNLREVVVLAYDSPVEHDYRWNLAGKELNNKYQTCLNQLHKYNKTL